MPAAIRSGSVDFPLFLHVLGAMLLAGAVGASVVLGIAGWRGERRALLTTLAFRALGLVAIPSYVLMRVGAEWTLSAGDYDEDAGWVGTGMAVADLGVLLLVLTLLVGWWASRRGGGWQGRVVTVLLSAYLAALAVAWWVMTAKP
jgi:hypothetical protein